MKTYRIILLTTILIQYNTIEAQSWIEKSRPTADIETYYSVDFAEGMTYANTIGYLIGNNSSPESSNVFFKTYNSGTNWSGPINISSPPPVCHPGAIACSNDGIYVIIVGGDDIWGTHGVIKRSTNGGNTFVNDIFDDEPGLLTDIQIFQNMAVAVGRGGRILINPDINNSCWYNVVTSFNYDFTDVSVGYDIPSASYYIYSIGNNSVVRGKIKDLCSIPQGEWEETMIEANNFCYGISIVFGNPKNIVTTSFTTSTPSIPAINFSVDYGTTWNSILLPNYLSCVPRVNDISCSGSYIYYSGLATISSNQHHFVLRQNPINNTFVMTFLGQTIDPTPTIGGSITFSKMSNNQYFGYTVGASNNFYVSSSTSDNASSNNEHIFKSEEFIANEYTKNFNKDLEILNISPNPTTDFCKIDILSTYDGIVELDIINIFGEKLNSFNTTVKSGNLHQYIMDLSSYNPGIYIIRINSKGFLDAKTLVVQ